MAHKKRGRELEPADWELDDALQQLHGILDRSTEQKMRVSPEAQVRRWAGRVSKGLAPPEAAHDPNPLIRVHLLPDYIAKSTEQAPPRGHGLHWRRRRRSLQCRPLAHPCKQPLSTL